ncbi:MAG: lysophospholipid acyltransferase family protein [Bacteroidota bacterium]|nr:lysophospholipid acyltransferase family protein [Bacteroidota bacterium]MEC9209384.1 lysophospholipid acyltransferase family protein [Bacteroidota bacterium]
MKWIGYLFSSIWRLWFLIVFILVFLIFIPALFFFTAIKKDSIAVANLTRYWSKLTIWLSFIFPILEWEDKIDKKKHYIFCPNHVSTLDIPLILAVIPVPLQYIGKVEIAKLPVFGYFYRNNSVIVNRENRKDAYTAFLRAGERLKEGLSMCIFPEGGIPPANIFLKKFKNGPFRLAIEQNVTVVPITIPDNKNIFPPEYFKGRPGIVRIKVHKAIDPNKLAEKTIENLNTSVYNTIFTQLKNYEE